MVRPTLNITKTKSNISCTEASMFSDSLFSAYWCLCKINRKHIFVFAYRKDKRKDGDFMLLCAPQGGIANQNQRNCILCKPARSKHPSTTSNHQHAKIVIKSPKNNLDNIQPISIYPQHSHRLQDREQNKILLTSVRRSCRQVLLEQSRAVTSPKQKN